VNLLFGDKRPISLPSSVYAVLSLKLNAILMLSDLMSSVVWQCTSLESRTISHGQLPLPRQYLIDNIPPNSLDNVPLDNIPLDNIPLGNIPSENILLDNCSPRQYSLDNISQKISPRQYPPKSNYTICNPLLESVEHIQLIAGNMAKFWNAPKISF